MPVMRAATLVLAVLAACRSDSGGGSRTVEILALAGDQAEVGASVISHGRDGTVIDRTVADVVGRAAIGVDDDSLISVVFPGTISSATPVVSVVTTVAPPGDAVLGIHGPDRNGPPALVVGVLEINAPNLASATYFAIDVGCATVRITKFPEFIDVGACSMGSDTSLDVLARAYHDVGGDPPAPVLDGYAAGRAQMVDGHAVLDLPAWQTSGTTIPLMLDGVTPLVSWTLYADGVPFVGEQIVGNAFAYANLAVDTTMIQATIAGTGFARITDRYVMGVPISIAFAATDFVAAFDLTTEVVETAPLAMRWDAAPSSVDAINLHASWGGSGAFVVPGSARVVWDVIVPPDVTSASLPALDGDLGDILGGADGLSPTDVVLRHIDSTQLADFAALQAAGLHADETIQTSTIAPRPSAGELRSAHTIGVR